MQLNKKLALLYGVMLGDGCLSHMPKHYHSDLAVIGCYYDDLPFFENIVSPLFEKFRNKPVSIRKLAHRGCIKIEFSDKILFNKFKRLGFPVGKKGTKLFIPKTFLESKIFMKCIVQGLFATDGSIVLTKNPNKYYPRIEFSSISEKMMRQVLNYLISLGFKGKLYKKRSTGKWEDLYRIQLNGLKNLTLFKERIGFVNPKHSKKFNLFLDYSERYAESIRGIPNQKQRFFRINELNGATRI